MDLTPLVHLYGMHSTQVTPSRPSSLLPSSAPVLILDTLKPAEIPLTPDPDGYPSQPAALHQDVPLSRAPRDPTHSSYPDGDQQLGGIRAETGSRHCPSPDMDRGPSSVSGVSLVVRLYEPYGLRGTARLSWNPKALPVQRIVKCNLLEDEQADGEVPIEISKGFCLVEYTPFQVLSLKLYVQSKRI